MIGLLHIVDIGHARLREASTYYIYRTGTLIVGLHLFIYRNIGATTAKRNIRK